MDPQFKYFAVAAGEIVKWVVQFEIPNPSLFKIPGSAGSPNGGGGTRKWVGGTIDPKMGT